MSLFDVIDELFPKKMVAEQLKQFTTPTSSSTTASTKHNKFKRANTASYTVYRAGGRQAGGNVAT
jgi:hypothetical protein